MIPLDDVVQALQSPLSESVVPRTGSRSDPQERLVAVAPAWFRSVWFDADVVVYGFADPLLTAEITFGSLHGYMSEQELNLVKFSTARDGTASRLSGVGHAERVRRSRGSRCARVLLVSNGEVPAAIGFRAREPAGGRLPAPGKRGRCNSTVVNADAEPPQARSRALSENIGSYSPHSRAPLQSNLCPSRDHADGERYQLWSPR